MVPSKVQWCSSSWLLGLPFHRRNSQPIHPQPLLESPPIPQQQDSKVHCTTKSLIMMMFLNKLNLKLIKNVYVLVIVFRYGLVFKTSIAGRHAVVSADPKLNHHLFLQEGRSVELWYLDTFTKLFAQDGAMIGNKVAGGDVHRYIRSIVLNHFGAESIKERILPRLHQTMRQTFDTWCTHNTVELKHAISMVIIIPHQLLQFNTLLIDLWIVIVLKVTLSQSITIQKWRSIMASLQHLRVFT